MQLFGNSIDPEKLMLWIKGGLKLETFSVGMNVWDFTTYIGNVFQIKQVS